jgi:hypothetical protein
LIIRRFSTLAVQLPDLGSSYPVTAITLRRPRLGVTISIRGDRPGWWAELGDEIDLSKYTVVEVAVSVAGGAKGAPPEPAPLPTPVELRPGLIESYRRRHRCSMKEIAARAVVAAQALRAWRAGKLSDRSVKSARIEALLVRGIRSDA